MQFKEILSKLTGIGGPIFGLSWQPSENERSMAKRIIIFLEPRRVLYSEYEYELVHHCITSVIEIRNFLTSELSNINENSDLNSYVRSMRNSCNKFLNKCPDNNDFRHCIRQEGNIDSWVFVSAIGELRGVFGIMVGQIAKAYGFDVEADLSQIIPE